ncbi:MAG: PrsW family glutamic-type intramembrane protease [Thermoplasmatota archaeon]
MCLGRHARVVDASTIATLAAVVMAFVLPIVVAIATLVALRAPFGPQVLVFSASGAIVAGLVFVVRMAMGANVMDGSCGAAGACAPWGAAALFVAGAPLLEETGKGLAVALGRPWVGSPSHGWAAGCFVGLGFALVENAYAVGVAAAFDPGHLGTVALGRVGPALLHLLATAIVGGTWAAGSLCGLQGMGGRVPAPNERAWSAAAAAQGWGAALVVHVAFNAAVLVASPAVGSTGLAVSGALGAACAVALLLVARAAGGRASA